MLRRMAGTRSHHAARRIGAFLASLRLFVLLAVVVCVLSLVATAIPQGEPREFYDSRFPAPVALAIHALGLSEFFTSPLLLVLALLLLINLVACTLPRFYRTIRGLRKGQASYKRSGHTVVHRRISLVLLRAGADVLHLGLAVLIVTAIVSIATRDDRLFTVTEGGEVEHRGDLFRVVGSQEIIGSSGEFENTVLDWRASLEMTGEGSTDPVPFDIGLNDPWGRGSLRVSFVDWSQEVFVTVEDLFSEGASLRPGEAMLLSDGTLMVFYGPHTANAGIFLFVPASGDVVEELILESGAIFGQYRVGGLRSVVTVSFLVSHNPSRRLGIAGIVIVLMGMGLIAIRYLRM